MVIIKAQQRHESMMVHEKTVYEVQKYKYSLNENIDNIEKIKSRNEQVRIAFTNLRNVSCRKGLPVSWVGDFKLEYQL